jgi:DNA polymerase-1
MSARPLVWLLDAYEQVFRAYHALPDLRAPDGRPVAAVRGYASTLIRFLRTHQPTHVAAAFDAGMTSFRNELWPDYKLGRTEAPPDLEPQFEACERVTRALGLAAFAVEKYEADDVIATLVSRLLPGGADVRIVARDKDLCALVSERVTMYDLGKEQITGPAEVEARTGVPPALVSDWLALAGDQVDHVPGVSGIGGVTAATLLRRFGRASEIPNDADALAAAGIRNARRVAEHLRAGRERLALSTALVRLRADLPLASSLADLEWQGADRDALAAALVPLGLESLVARVHRFRA